MRFLARAPRLLPFAPILLMALLTGAVPAQQVDWVAITHVDALTMGERGRIADATVVIGDGRIREVGAASEVTIPEGARRIDGGGGTLLPGLIDAHVHLRRANALRAYVAHGFTTVRDMNGNMSMTRAARDLVAAGEMVGARVVAGSPTVLPGPYGTYPDPPTTQAEGRALAALHRDAGFDLIKVYRLRPEGFRGLMAAAHELGIPVAGHVPSMGLDDPDSPHALDFEEVLASGMSSLEHIVEVARAGMSELGPDALEQLAGASPNEVRAARQRLHEVAAALARSGIAVGTLVGAVPVYNRLLEDRQGYLRDAGARIEAMTGAAGIRAIESMDMSGWTVVPLATAHALARTFHQAGVKLIVGTDSHHPLLLAGHSGLLEIEFLIDAGLSPEAALRAATVDAAEVLGLAEETGRIAPGLAADLLLVPADPLDDIAALRDREGVMVNGRWLDRAALSAVLAGAVAEGLW